MVNDSKIKADKKIEDLGIGSKVTSKQRFINRDGSFNVVREGVRHWTLYHYLSEESWPRFLGHIVIYYVLVNMIFAFIFMSIGVENLSGVESGNVWSNFSNAFFFSVQTFTTVGYGGMSPISPAAHWVSSLDALVGLLSTALLTGILFARFSKPKAQILYSENAVIAPYQDGKGLMFRVANLRNNRIIDLEANVSATWLEQIDGSFKRRYAVLPLERRKIFLFPLSWTIVHPINEESPFFGKTEKEIDQFNLEILVLLKGYDESYNQIVHSNSSYFADEIVWNAKFKLMFHSDDEKGTILELDKINDMEILEGEK